jgi:hypothetical protein
MRQPNHITKGLIILLVLLSTNIFAQNSNGFMAGINFATLTGDSTRLPNRDFRYGARAGAFWNINVKYNTYFEFGIFYSQQGANFKNEFFQYNKEVLMLNENKIDYIQIPFAWKETYNNIYTKIGLNVEFAANAKSTWFLEYKYRDSSQTYQGEYGSFVNNLRLYDLGIYLGAGFQFPTRKNLTFLVDFSFFHGIFPLNTGVYRTEYVMRNMVFSASLGILFEKTTKSKYKIRRR